MGRRTKDQPFVRAREVEGGVGDTHNPGDGPRGSHQLLPYDYCALTFMPIDDGVFLENGLCFERDALLKYIRDHSKNPIDGSELTEGKVYPLKLRKNDAGNYFCPVSEKEFSIHSHIVAIRTTGNVYMHDIVDQLNIKAKDYTDLVFGTPFKRTDIIVLQDPKTMWDKRNAAKFYHTKSADAQKAQLQALRLKEDNMRTSTAVGDKAGDLDPSDPEYARDLRARQAIARDIENNARFAAAGFTSTGKTPYAKDEQKTLTQDQVVEEKVFEEFRSMCAAPGSERHHDATVELDTSLGVIQMKVHCGVCPKTAYNFLALAERDYYSGTVFHRVVRDFVMQGGDPTGTGTGGTSCWGGTFGDEIFGRFKHDKKGIVSMANSGRDSNGSQFFITLAPAPFLDGKHTVFGMVTAGLDVLDKANSTPTDPGTECPSTPIVLKGVRVLQSPFTALRERFADEVDPVKRAQRAAAEKKRHEDGQQRGSWFSGQQTPLPNQESTAVGKYLTLPAGDKKGKKEKKDKKEKKKRKRDDEAETDGGAAAAEAEQAAKRAAQLKQTLGAKPAWDFSKW
eukprot:TRINITY_DN3942_c0_g1_i1.p1 TRINITY_DN3942_c0_g1~~TRINITY_DN3942_c0_g1_i1.p1  ORF type:complete len:565 (+),score=257.89 TRINITY_DN3942_c0_g1_i1:41-1735(+)